MTDSDQTPLRRLAFFYHPRSFSVFALAEAARDVCEFIWIIDAAIEGSEEMVPLLRRKGTVVNISGLDVAAAASAVAAERPDGILTLKDSLMQQTAALAEQLGLPFHSADVARRFTDKHLQRAALRDGGLPVPQFWNVPDSVESPEWDEFAATARFPAVLKPRHNSEGSRDTVLVSSLMEVRDALLEQQDGQSAAELDTAAERSGLVLEEYLEDRDEGVRFGFADYVSVETIVSSGEISHLAVTGRFPPAEPFRESGFFIDAELSDSDREAALSTATAAVTALGVTLGCLHTEIKFTPSGPRVIELNGRIGGGVPEMLLDATGVEFLPIALRLALGDSVSFPEPPKATRVAYLFYVQSPVWMRRVTAVEGLKELGAEPGVAEVLLNRGPGQPVHWRHGNHGHVFSVRGVVADHDALLEMARWVTTEIVICGEGEQSPDGEDVASVTSTPAASV